MHTVEHGIAFAGVGRRVYLDKATKERSLAHSSPSASNLVFGSLVGLEQDLGTLMCVNHMKLTYDVMPDDVRYFFKVAKGGVRQEIDMKPYWPNSYVWFVDSKLSRYRVTPA